MKKNIFKRHLNEVKESYGRHLLFTLSLAANLTLAALFILIHGIIPFIFVNAGSDLVNRIHKKLVNRHNDHQ